MKQPPIEPSFYMRSFARTQWEMYTAFKNQGFTEEQALDLVCTSLHAVFSQSDTGE